MTAKELVEMQYNLGVLRGLTYTIQQSDIFDMVTGCLDDLEEKLTKMAKDDLIERMVDDGK